MPLNNEELFYRKKKTVGWKNFCLCSV